jgi:hypothetical protein
MKQLLLIILTLGLFFCGKKEEQKVSSKGTVKFAVGDVSIVTKGTKTPAKKGDGVAEGDSILTGAKSAAVIDFERNAGSVEIQQNSEFVISKFNAKEQELISKSGSFWLDAKKLNKDTNFQVIMPTSVAGIRGTKLYSFEIKEAGITGVCHCQGAVDFKENSSNYSGSHDSDYLVMTKAGKTVVLTPEDFKKIGITSDGNHNHSMLDDSPLGKKADQNTENAKKIGELVAKKFGEK